MKKIINGFKGEYAVSVWGKDMICIPRRWRSLFKKKKLYCEHCRDGEYEYLRFFVDPKSKMCLEQDTEYGIKVLSRSFHRVFPGGLLLRLPDKFLKPEDRKEVVFYGLLEFFELWKKDTSDVRNEKEGKEWEELLNGFMEE